MTAATSPVVGPVSASPPAPPAPPSPGSGAGGGGEGGGGTSPVTGQRFYTSPLHREIITDLQSHTVRLLDRYVFDRTAAFTLNLGATFSGSVHSDEPRVSIVYDGDDAGLPALAEGVRLLYDFRAEDPTGEVPWSCRFAGPILNVVDRTDTDTPIADFIAYDPWQYMYSLPIVKFDGTVIETDGQVFPDLPGSQIAAGLLGQALAAITGPTEGMLNLIDAGPDYGGTVFWQGVIEDSPVLRNFPASVGSSIGQKWTDLTATGTMDIVLTPIYDPVNRPGYCADLSIFAIDPPDSQGAGSLRQSAIFGWDTLNRSLISLQRTIDGRARANVLRLFSGVGGIPGDLVDDATSIAEFGQYWAQQFYPQNTVKSAANLLAQQQLQLRKNGLRTYAMTPVPERGPPPFTDWYLGDRVFPSATARFREPINPVGSGVRIQGFGLTISDDAMETVTPALVSPDFSP